MNTAKPKYQPVDNRKRYYTLLAIGKAQLGWDDEFYYGIWLPMQGASLKDGKYSASTLTNVQLFQAVERMKDAGFKPTRTKAGKKFTHEKADFRTARIAKLNALWCALADRDLVTNRSQVALEHWCQKHTKKDRLQWASSKELNTCIEQLKAWSKRVGMEV